MQTRISLHEKSKYVVWEKSKTNIVNLSSAELAKGAVKVNNNGKWFWFVSFSYQLIGFVFWKLFCRLVSLLLRHQNTYEFKIWAGR